MFKTLIKTIHKGLTLTYATSTTVSLANTFADAGYINKVAGVVGAKLPQEYKDTVKTAIEKLGDLGLNNFTYSDLLNPKANFSNISDSGIVGAAELYLSKSIFGQTTHFGFVPQALTCYYGEGLANLVTNHNSELVLGLGAMAAFEATYWWVDCDTCDDHPEIA